MSPIPRLEQLGPGAHQLLVADQPFLMRPAELNNSSFSSSVYMAEAYPRLVKNNVNTLLGSVSWEQIEPREGEFEFEELDRVIMGARKWGFKLVILWFGAYKNGMFKGALPHLSLCSISRIANHTRFIDLHSWMGQNRLEAVPTSSNLNDSRPKTSCRGCYLVVRRPYPDSGLQGIQEIDATHRRGG